MNDIKMLNLTEDNACDCFKYFIAFVLTMIFLNTSK